MYTYMYFSQPAVKLTSLVLLDQEIETNSFGTVHVFDNVKYCRSENEDFGYVHVPLILTLGSVEQTKITFEQDCFKQADE